jgi:hypothetical protein
MSERDEKGSPERSTKSVNEVYEPPKLTKFEKLEKLIVSGE